MNAPVCNISNIGLPAAAAVAVIRAMRASRLACGVRLYVLGGSHPTSIIISFGFNNRLITHGHQHKEILPSPTQEISLSPNTRKENEEKRMVKPTKWRVDDTCYYEPMGLGFRVY